jgi:hypothetical protein
MQVARLKIDDAISRGFLYVGVRDVPFFGEAPVENLGSSGHFRDLQRIAFLNRRQCLPQPFASGASAVRIKLSCERMRLPADFREVLPFDFV